MASNRQGNTEQKSNTGGITITTSNYTIEQQQYKQHGTAVYMCQHGTGTKQT
jgi:hypothetical protein